MRGSGVRVGDCLEGRFELLERVGEGAFSVVFEARDLQFDEIVAIKLFRDQVEQDLPWREASSLGLLRAPGVVGLVEEGRHDGRAFLALEYVDGAPFPGTQGPHSWSRLAPLLERLLETLAHVHQQGIVHRDIKPGNVLVTPRGDVKLLDFNLSYNHRLQWQTAQHAAFYGTLSYVAPEQIRNGPTTARTDLYAVGVMLFEALAGELPFRGDSYPRQIRSILMSTPPDLGELRPDLAPEVVELVMRLIARDPDARPASAREVVDRMQRDIAASSASEFDGLPLVARAQQVLSEVLEAVREGDDVTIVGAPGSGKTLVLSALEAHLEAEGVAHLESADVTEVLLVDDADRAEPSARAVLVATPRAGRGVVRTMTTAPSPTHGERLVHLEAVSARELSSLFRGPERIFRLKSQPADVLHARTGGRLGAAHAELARWVRLGLASWQGSELVMTSESVAYLQAGFGWEGSAPNPPRMVEGSEQSMDSHRLRAESMPLHDPMRLFHWLSAGERERFLDEVLVTASVLDERGRITLAVTCLREGLRVANRSPRALESCRALLMQWAKIALSTSTASEIERVLHALTRTEGVRDEEEFVALAALLRCARRASVKFGQEHVDALAALAPFDDEELELRRVMYQVRAIWSQPLEDIDAKLEEVAPWVSASALAQVQACMLGWRGSAMVLRGSFREAAALHEQAARLHPRRSAAISAMLNSASAHIDGLENDAAVRIADEARELALSCHHRVNEAMALYLVRAARYRSGQELELDPDLLEAASQLDVPSIEALLNLLEAAIAWRSGQDASAFAGRARRIWVTTGNRWGELLAASLELLTSKEAPEASTVASLVARVAECPIPRIALQVAGLVSSGSPELRERVVSTIDPMALAGRIPREQWGSRLEVMSIEEALEAL